MAELCNTFPIICVVGPTASGKTGLAIKLAQHFDAEIISCDSMQIYKFMNIGTAKPSEAEMCGIKHHLIDFLDPSEDFSVAQYVNLAKEKIRDIISSNKRVILVGGTGLYYSSLIDGIELSPIESDIDIRKKYADEYERVGGEVMLSRLKEFDSVLAKKLHANDKTRIIRAFEVYELTGVALSEHQQISRLHESPFIPCVIGLNFADRSVLYSRIDKRVDQMLQSGLLDEARFIFQKQLSHTASGAIAYKELFPYFNKEKTLDECVEFLKMQSRRYAKRQLTWFRHDEKVNWIEVDNCNNVFKRALEIIGESKIFKEGAL